MSSVLVEGTVAAVALKKEEKVREMERKFQEVMERTKTLPFLLLGKKGKK